jgi:hypothetical protein
MARIFDANFESKNVTYETISIVGSPTISNDVYFKGVNSMRFNATGSEVSALMRGDPGSAVDNVVRIYTIFKSFPASLTKIIQFIDAGGDHTSIRVASDGTLELWTDSGTPAKVGSSSSALSLSNPFRIELDSGLTHAGNDVQARLEGTEFASSASHPAGSTWRQLEIGVMGSVTCDLYIDSVALNNHDGTTNNSWPGEDFTLVKTAPNTLRPAIFTGGIAK